MQRICDSRSVAMGINTPLSPGLSTTQTNLYAPDLNPFLSRRFPTLAILNNNMIFLSHLHCDLERIRPLRHELERRAPSARFFLRCPENDDSRLPELLL